MTIVETFDNTVMNKKRNIAPIVKYTQPPPEISTVALCSISFLSFSPVFLNKNCAVCNFETFPLSHEHLSMSRHIDSHPHFPNILSGKFSNIQKNCRNFPVNTRKHTTWILPLTFCCFIPFLSIGPSLSPSIKQSISSMHFKMPTAPFESCWASTKCARHRLLNQS